MTNDNESVKLQKWRPSAGREMVWENAVIEKSWFQFFAVLQPFKYCVISSNAFSYKSHSLLSA